MSFVILSEAKDLSCRSYSHEIPACVGKTARLDPRLREDDRNDRLQLESRKPIRR